MIDYNTITTVSKNFNYEQTIAENETLRHNNKLLITVGVVFGICFFGATIYFITEERKVNKTY